MSSQFLVNALRGVQSSRTVRLVLHRAAESSMPPYTVVSSGRGRLQVAFVSKRETGSKSRGRSSRSRRREERPTAQGRPIDPACLGDPDEGKPPGPKGYGEVLRSRVRRIRRPAERPATLHAFTKSQPSTARSRAIWWVIREHPRRQGTPQGSCCASRPPLWRVRPACLK